MAGETSASAALLEHAKHFHSLVGAEAILEYLCRVAQRLGGARIAFGSHAPPGEPWQRGLHIAIGDAASRAAPAMVSATFALHRRLSAHPELLVLSRAEESEAIFRGLVGDAGSESVLFALPLLNRRARLVGQVVLVANAAGALSSSSMGELLDVASLASLAMENAQRLAFARRDQDRLLLLAETTEEALWDWDLESNAFWWGGGIQNVIQHGGEVIGATASWKLERIHPADVDAVKASLQRARLSNDSTWREEYRFRRADGSWATVEDRAYFQRDVSGRAYRMLGALRDITRERWIDAQQALLVHASAALAASLEVEKNLETVAELATTTVADGCSIIVFGSGNDKPPSLAVAHRDPERARRMRSALETALGEPRTRLDEPTTASVIRKFSEAHRLAFVENLPLLAAALDESAPASLLHVPLVSGDSVIGHITLFTSSESMRAYDLADLAFAEELARRCGVAVDKARLYEQAQDAIRARDAFMAILGHELRNPLSPITTALHLMKLRDPRSVREQEVIERQVKHLTRLVDDLLDISRIERGKIELSKRPVQLAEVVAKAVEIVSPLLEQRRHRLELHVPAAGLPLLADETRVAQVVANLLTNAARYTDEGGLIRVAAARDKRDIVLSVRDNGIGMAPELLPRVFDLFVQAPRSSDRRQGGLGLGLSLVKSLVMLHGGTVEAHSEGLGKGSEFVVRVPAMVVELVTSDVRAASREQPPAAHPKRILIVDDNTDAAELLTELLQTRGHEVLVAHDGPGALIVAPRFEPEVAILDIGLPVMDGYELARRLVAIVPHRPFLVALTGYGQEQDRSRANEAGFDEHMVKPLEPARLLRMLEGASIPKRAQLGDDR